MLTICRVCREMELTIQEFFCGEIFFQALKLLKRMREFKRIQHNARTIFRYKSLVHSALVCFGT